MGRVLLFVLHPITRTVPLEESSIHVRRGAWFDRVDTFTIPRVKAKAVQRQIGRNLARARWRLGVSQETLCARGPFTVRQYQRYEAGEVDLHISTLTGLADLVSVRVADLLEMPAERRPAVKLSEVRARPPRPGRKAGVVLKKKR